MLSRGWREPEAARLQGCCCPGEVVVASPLGPLARQLCPQPVGAKSSRNAAPRRIPSAAARRAPSPGKAALSSESVSRGPPKPQKETRPPHHTLSPSPSTPTPSWSRGPSPHRSCQDVGVGPRVRAWGACGQRGASGGLGGGGSAQPHCPAAVVAAGGLSRCCCLLRRLCSVPTGSLLPREQPGLQTVDQVSVPGAGGLVRAGSSGEGPAGSPGTRDQGWKREAAGLPPTVASPLLSPGPAPPTCLPVGLKWGAWGTPAPDPGVCEVLSL